MKFLLAACVLLGGCGYHVSGHADLLPKTIRTVCIPAFGNATMRYKLTDRLPEAISREFIARTRYHIVHDCNTADAILRGSVNNYFSNTTVFDPTTGRASAADLRAYLQINFVERTTGKILFNTPNMEVRERYEISVVPGPYFEESDAALERVSRAAARQVVDSILESF